MKVFIVFLLIHYSLQEEQTESVCESECGAEADGFCNAVCAYNDTDVLCECSETRDGIECVTPDGDNCPGISTDELDENDCKVLSAAEEVVAYKFTNLLGRPKCTLLKSCWTESNNPNPTPVVNAKKKCGTCPALNYIYGPTVIHYDCNFGDFNPYVQAIPTGTKCSPTHSCEDVSSSDVYTCLLNPATTDGVGKWQKNGLDVDTPLDVTCNCPELKVADEIGTKLSCTTPVEAEGGFYTLTEANTCGLICDGFYILELTCGFKAGDEGTVWKAEWDDGYTQDLEVTCLACLDNKKCDDAPTAAPTAAPTEAPTAAPTEAPTAAPTSAPTEAPPLRQ